MKELLIATNNRDKVKEIRHMLEGFGIEIYSLDDKGIGIEVVEDKDTLEGNALKKAKEIWDHTGIPCSADDTGLFVDALNGEPGVYSSRYAGENVTYADNRKKLLSELSSVSFKVRTAEFRTVVCYYYGENEYKFFTGVCKGVITEKEKGENGFGYDAIFQPDGYEKTFAELDLGEKNKISHRAKAFMKFREYLLKN
ncbi:MAG: RdgB/HAM1 family non-canonical purine NTP pyrophosphatase [Ignavibacteria bacterium]|nr:RdgB/HAM1 family non-canonical purine NTP pyrophosphatase [Ignavibacteria bacterium]